MQHFNIGALGSWRPVALGELFDFALPQNGYRSVHFDVMASELVAVYAVAGASTWLVGVGQGMIECKFSTNEAVGVVVTGPDGADVYMRTRIETQVVDVPDDPIFTSIEPRRVGPPDELKRMMLLMQLNMKRREAELMGDMERRLAAIEARPPVTEAVEVIEPTGGQDA